MESEDDRKRPAAAETADVEAKPQRLDEGQTIQKDDFADAFSQIKRGDLTLKIMLEHHFPHLINNVDFWWAFLAIKDELPPLSCLYEVLFDNKPQSAFNQKELMLQLCSYDVCIFAVIPIDHPLKIDEQIVGAVLAASPPAYLLIPRDRRPEFASMIGKAFARQPLWDDWHRKIILRLLDARIWNSRDSVLGWAKGGGNFHGDIPERFLEDEEIVLAFTTTSTKRRVMASHWKWIAFHCE